MIGFRTLLEATNRIRNRLGRPEIEIAREGNKFSITAPPTATYVTNSFERASGFLQAVFKRDLLELENREGKPKVG